MKQPQAVQERVSVTPRKNKLRFGNALGHETSAFCEMQIGPKALAEGKHEPPGQLPFEAAPPQVSRVVAQVLGVMVWVPLGCSSWKAAPKDNRRWLAESRTLQWARSVHRYCPSL